MALAKITEVTGRGIHVPGDDIDTDRIIPARFMKCVTFDGLGEYLFHDVRFDEDGNPNILIDDWSKNTIPWAKKGGIAIQHVKANTSVTVGTLRKMGF